MAGRIAFDQNCTGISAMGHPIGFPNWHLGSGNLNFGLTPTSKLLGSSKDQEITVKRLIDDRRHRHDSLGQRLHRSKALPKEAEFSRDLRDA